MKKNKAKKTKISAKEKFLFVWGYLKGHKKYLISLSLITILTSLIFSITPLLFGKAIDIAIGKIENFWNMNLVQIIIVWFLIAIVGLILNRKYIKDGVGYSVRVEKDVMVKITNHIIHLYISFHEEAKPGEIFKKIIRTSEGLNYLIENFAFRVIPDSLMVIIGFVVMFAINWQMATVMLIMFVLFNVVTFKYKLEEIIKSQRQINKKYNKIFGNLGDIYENVFTVKANTAETKEIRETESDFNKTITKVDSQMKLWSNASFLQQTIIELGLMALIILAIFMLVHNLVTPGIIVIFIAYYNMITLPLYRLGMSYRLLRRVSVDIEDTIKFAKEEEEKDSPMAIDLKKVDGELEFHHVTFKYPNNKTNTIKDVNFKIEKGKTLAIFGKTGAGKTTLYKLIMRLFDPQKGRILLDGIDIKHVKIRSLREQIAVVPQIPLLFNDTILNNIKYGNPEASMEEVKKAANVANAHDFIMNLPKKYDSVVGERGVRLSGGQMQRVIIAQALLRDPKILILDEATSSLDQATKFEVLDALKKLIKGRTTIIITHDFSAISKNADKIIVLKNGKIIQRGKHADLVRKKGLYQDLYKTQQKQLQI